MNGIIKYLTGLVNIHDPASTQACLTILVVCVLLLLTVGVTITALCVSKPLLQYVISLLSATTSLVGLQGIKETIQAKITTTTQVTPPNDQEQNQS